MDFSKTSYLASYRWSNLTQSHRLKERKPQVSPTMPVFTPFSLKVAWSGKSLIMYTNHCLGRSYAAWPGHILVHSQGVSEEAGGEAEG